MTVQNMPEPQLETERPFEGFENLMPFRVQDILLVSSLYDCFILREDGRLNELLIGESLELNLQQVPGITHVSGCAEALELIRSQPRFNLIVSNLSVGETDAAELAHEIKRLGIDVPVVVLAYDYREIKDFVARHPQTDIDRIFLWQGNARMLIAIVKYIEDKRNALHDTRVAGVPIILLVEDNIRYYSSFLPVIYTELINQSRRVISEGLNAAHRLLRMRARPKILLASTYEEASRLVDVYRNYLFGVISDIEFPRGGQLSTDTGFDLVRQVRSLVPDVPVVLQSSRTRFKASAQAEGFSFLHKRSPTLLRELRRLLTEQFGFGDFVFRMPDGSEVARATDLNALEERVRSVPHESIAFHGQRNHFSHWLMARTEFALAQKLRPRKVCEFASSEHLRRDLIASIAEYRREQSNVLVGDFKADSFKAADPFFLQIGEGSLGGKARGLAFVRHLLHTRSLSQRFPGVNLTVPSAVVLATDVFDRFLSENSLLDHAINCNDDAELQRRFLAAPLPVAVQEDLTTFLSEVCHPLAIRSSSLLEDSQYRPFTGVYETFMLGNYQAEIEVRLRQLMEAIKRVYASTLSQRAKAYVRLTPYRLEEEKMAVILQEVVGTFHGQRFYPDFSGVLRSRNFYPVSPMKSEDGIAAVALGLGREVVGGGTCLRFCPRYPRSIMQFSSVDDALANSQTEFWALELDHDEHLENPLANLREARLGLDAAEHDGVLHMLGSTYSKDNHAIYDGVSRPGARVVSFAPILKHGVFPLAEILQLLMRVGEEALGRAVEIEFAVSLPRHNGEIADFGFLQIRPLVRSTDGQEVHMEDMSPELLICRSSQVLGHGRIGNLRDAIVVDWHGFDRSQSHEVARGIRYFNTKLGSERIPYLLIGVGRWGSDDPWLGIPVAWEEISGARVLIEAGFRDFRVTPSQGSHFFQNLMASQAGYFTVNPDVGEGFVDWQWLASQPAEEEQGCVRHLHFTAPLVVLMNGKTSTGMIFKPGGNGHL